MLDRDEAEFMMMGSPDPDKQPQEEPEVFVKGGVRYTIYPGGRIDVAPASGGKCASGTEPTDTEVWNHLWKSEPLPPDASWLEHFGHLIVTLLTNICRFFFALDEGRRFREDRAARQAAHDLKRWLGDAQVHLEKQVDTTSHDDEEDPMTGPDWW